MLNINVIYEAIVVGIYLDILFRIIYIIFGTPSLFSLFFVGFLKHFFGYYLQLQSLFCKYRGKHKAIKNNYFLLNCVKEGIIFTLMYLFINNAFVTGFVMHIISEYIGLHKSFIRNSCR